MKIKDNLIKQKKDNIKKILDFFDATADPKFEKFWDLCIESIKEDKNIPSSEREHLIEFGKEFKRILPAIRYEINHTSPKNLIKKFNEFLKYKIQ